MTELEKKQLKTFNQMIDINCESMGINATIDMLMKDYGFTKEEMLEMSFEEKDIDYFLKQRKALDSYLSNNH